MFMATLIAAPDHVLDPALAEALRNAWGGGAVDWLSPDEAAEFPLETRPDNLWQVWDDLQSQRVDLMVQPAEGRRKSVLIADMDSTIIAQECIDELAAEAGIGDEVAAITARAMNGELDFEGALRERVSFLKGQPSGIVQKVIDERITFMPGAPTLLATMRHHGAYAALVSGGFTDFTTHVAATLGFNEHRANRLIHDNGKLAGAVDEPILGRDAKVDALNEITATLGKTAEDVIAVGDGANDLGMLKLAGAGVALHAKPAVAKECDIRVYYGDLTALLYLQGYRRDEFITHPDYTS